jgi:hypothetical protein
MKVTVNFPDALIDEVMHFAGKSTVTESIIIALKEWIALKRIKELSREVQQTPIEINYPGTSSEEYDGFTGTLSP